MPPLPPRGTTTSTDPARLEARQVAQSVVESYLNAYDTHDPKAISRLFVADGVLLPPDGSPVVQGRDAIERSWESDCSVPFIFGYDLRSSRCGPANGLAGR
jgi:Nuclear transport factor 2 (NTF2) domain